MHNISAVDKGRTIDWGKTSQDYGKYRPGPPLSFFARLQAFGAGLPEQKILDLGTGTGVLARQFAKQGAEVSGGDISLEQIEEAQRLAREENLRVEFHVFPSENCPYPSHSFDLITANQCWLYFEKPKIYHEVRRLLKPGGRLVTSHFSWLPKLDPIARASEALVLQHNPQWSAAHWSGEIPLVPHWSLEDFQVQSFFVYDEAIPFTRESWRGRIRACRGVGAALSSEEVAAFDQAHAALLEKIAPPEFTILHRLDAHFFNLKP